MERRGDPTDRATVPPSELLANPDEATVDSHGFVHQRVRYGFLDSESRQDPVERTFLREKVPRNWRVYCDQVTDNFRVIDPADFRVLA